MNREPESHIIRISILVTEHGRKHEKEKKTENKKKHRSGKRRFISLV